MKQPKLYYISTINLISNSQQKVSLSKQIHSHCYQELLYGVKISDFKVFEGGS